MLRCLFWNLSLLMHLCHLLTAQGCNACVKMSLYFCLQCLWSTQTNFVHFGLIIEMWLTQIVCLLMERVDCCAKPDINKSLTCCLRNLIQWIQLFLLQHININCLYLDSCPFNYSDSNLDKALGVFAVVACMSAF